MRLGQEFKESRSQEPRTQNPEVRSQESEVAGGKKNLQKFFTPAPGAFDS
jgi:hypothetical protein